MKIGIADTTFARIDMARFAIDTIQSNSDHQIERYTVPGFKDLAVACKILFEKYNCDIVLAFGMAGGAPIDKTCAHEAALALHDVQLMCTKHILEVFVFTDETKDPQELISIAKNRSEKHALNAIELLRGKEALTPQAGSGCRQGKNNEGSLEEGQ